MVKTVVGILLALIGVWFYGRHLAGGGSPPHILWALMAGIVLLFGLWLALPGRRP